MVLIDSEKVNSNSYYTPNKIANTFMNRLTIDEDAAFELSSVCNVEMQRSLTSGQASRLIASENTSEYETHLIFALSYDVNLYRRNIYEQYMMKSLLKSLQIRSAVVTLFRCQESM